jgi:hypothetical protein
MLRFEVVRDDEVVGKVGDGLAGVSIALALSALPLARASFHTERRVGRHRGWWRVRVVVVEGSRLPRFVRQIAIFE